MYFFILQEKTQAQGFAMTKFEELRRWVKTVLSLIPPADEQGSLCLPSWLFCKPGCRLRVMGSLTDGSQGCQMHMCVNISAPLWGPNFLLGVQGTRLWSFEINTCLWRWANKRYLYATGHITTPCLLGMCLCWSQDISSWIKGIKVSSAVIKLKTAKKPFRA